MLTSFVVSSNGASGEAPDGAANVLIVDDREENLRVLEAILEPLGQNLVRARSGEEALKCLLRDDFALILLDVQMPGLDGFETARFIKQIEKTKLIPIIFLTGVSMEPREVFRGYSAGAVDYVVKPFDPGVLRSKVAVFIDLERATVALRQSEARFRSAFDDAPIGMGLVSIEGRWLEVNRSLCEIVGYAEDDLLAMDVEAITHPDDRDDGAYLHGVLEGDLRSAHVERRYIHADCREVCVAVNVSLIHDAHAQPAFIFQVADITERKRLEAFKQHFIQNAAHELRSPLTSISGIAETISDHRANINGELFEELIEALVRQSARARHLIDNLLDLSSLEKKPSVLLVPVDMHEAVARAIDLSVPPDGVRPANEVPDWLFVMADASRLEQVLVNLLVNAYHYGGGAITVEAVEDDQHVVVTVRDDGDGVPARFVPRLFDAFTRGTNAGTKLGSGLGLAIVKHILEVMGGTLWYEPALPRGASFRFRLPNVT
jgi:PAS domain S-box-containing protein